MYKPYMPVIIGYKNFNACLNEVFLYIPALPLLSCFLQCFKVNISTYSHHQANIPTQAQTHTPTHHSIQKQLPTILISTHQSESDPKMSPSILRTSSRALTRTTLPTALQRPTTRFFSIVERARAVAQAAEIQAFERTTVSSPGATPNAKADWGRLFGRAGNAGLM